MKGTKFISYAILIASGVIAAFALVPLFLLRREEKAKINASTAKARAGRAAKREQLKREIELEDQEKFEDQEDNTTDLEELEILNENHTDGTKEERTLESLD